MQTSIAEAAEHLDISPQTVRRRLANGLLNGYKEPTPQGYTWRVEIEETPAEPTPDGTSELINVLKSQVEDLKDQLTTRANEIDQLHQLLAHRSLESGTTRPWWKFWG